MKIYILRCKHTNPYFSGTKTTISKKCFRTSEAAKRYIATWREKLLEPVENPLDQVDWISKIDIVELELED